LKVDRNLGDNAILPWAKRPPKPGRKKNKEYVVIVCVVCCI